jgi:protein O-GlcNAc transferase
VADFVQPMLRYYDQEHFTVYLYYSNQRSQEDVTTRRFRKQIPSRQFRRIYGKTAIEIAQSIRNDEIDILIDLAGHSGMCRLDVFCLRPAPVQVTYCGYAATTGLNRCTGMDYRLVDEVTDPIINANSEQAQLAPETQLCSETLWRMPAGKCFLCQDRGQEYEVARVPEIKLHLRNHTPAMRGVVPTLKSDCTQGVPFHANFTFACTNWFFKINPAVLRVWAEILLRAPSSRLIIKYKSARHLALSRVTILSPNLFLCNQQTRIKQIFKDCGVENIDDRLEFQDRQTRPQYNHWLRKTVDLCLDTFPYSGTSTTFDCLKNGAPMITYCGPQVHYTRVTSSILKQLPAEFHQPLIAYSLTEYVEKAVYWATHIDEFDRFRVKFYPAVFASPLFQPAVFIQCMEEQYLDMWRKYMEQQQQNTTAALDSAGNRVGVNSGVARCTSARRRTSCPL